METRDRLFSFLKETLEANESDRISDDTPLFEEGAFDSLELMRLAIWIEKESCTSLDPTTFDLSKEWETPADIVNFIQRRRNR